jgi:DNA polymerase III subunit epsilon
MKSRTRKRSILTQHVNETDYCIVDVETTGLSVERGDRVCEIGAVRLRGGAVIETFGSLINPQRPISAGAYAVNKISPQMVAGAPEFTEIAEKLWLMMNETILVAYNAPFDLSFLTYEFKLAGYPQIENPVVDALVLARQLIPGLQTYQQQNVAAVVGIPFPVKHRALEDAMTTAQLFTIFTLILKAYDCTSCSDLQRRDLLNVLSEQRISLLRSAISKRSNIWIKYLSPSNAEISERIVTPKDCIEQQFGKTASMYLIAHCHLIGAERNFRVDRILDLRIIER